MNRAERPRLAALAATGAAAERLRSAESEVEAAVARALRRGASWTEVGQALGVTRQSAHRRFRRLHWDPATQTTWAEPTLPL